MFKIFFTNSDETKVIMEDVTSFKKSAGVFLVRNKRGEERIVKGRVKEILNSKIIIEGEAVRDTCTLAPLNF